MFTSLMPLPGLLTGDQESFSALFLWSVFPRQEKLPSKVFHITGPFHNSLVSVNCIYPGSVHALNPTNKF